MVIERTIKKISKVNITDARLLTVQEAKAIPLLYRVLNGKEWWLDMDEEDKTGRGAYVDGAGNVIYTATPRSMKAVRPVLAVEDADMADLCMYDTFHIGDLTFRMISQNLALCETSITDMCYDDVSFTNTSVALILPRFLKVWFDLMQYKNTSIYPSYKIEDIVSYQESDADDGDGEFVIEVPEYLQERLGNLWTETFDQLERALRSKFRNITDFESDIIGLGMRSSGIREDELFGFTYRPSSEVYEAAEQILDYIENHT